MRFVQNPLRHLTITVALITVLFAGVAASGLAHEGEHDTATPAASPGDGAAPAKLTHPAHIHEGTCDRLSSTPVEDLTHVRFPSPLPEGSKDDPVIPVMTSTTTIDHALADLLTGNLVIDVHVEGEQPGAVLACGTIGGTPSGSDLYIGLRETNSSAHAGVAWLHENEDGTTTVTILLAHGLAGSTS